MNAESDNAILRPLLGVLALVQVRLDALRRGELASPHSRAEILTQAADVLDGQAALLREIASAP